MGHLPFEKSTVRCHIIPSGTGLRNTLLLLSKHPFSPKKACLNSLERQISNSSLNAQNDWMKRYSAVSPSLSPLMDFYWAWAWTRSNLVRVKSQCRDVACNTHSIPRPISVFLRSQWFSVSTLQPNTKSSPSVLPKRKRCETRSGAVLGLRLSREKCLCVTPSLAVERS